MTSPSDHHWHLAVNSNIPPPLQPFRDLHLPVGRGQSDNPFLVAQPGGSAAGGSTASGSDAVDLLLRKYADLPPLQPLRWGGGRGNKAAKTVQSASLYHGHPPVNAIPQLQAQGPILQLAPPQHYHPPGNPAVQLPPPQQQPQSILQWAPPHHPPGNPVPQQQQQQPIVQWASPQHHQLPGNPVPQQLQPPILQWAPQLHQLPGNPVPQQQ
ncbi:hypothetical protein BU17DRAFT_85818 [Hysterangium stoloniferum]|nr:hypothetical protein BU17DRAFT_85818 [Hysterangium stoloniferum]